jgi:hypothetical protein
MVPTLSPDYSDDEDTFERHESSDEEASNVSDGSDASDDDVGLLRRSSRVRLPVDRLRYDKLGGGE